MAGLHRTLCIVMVLAALAGCDRSQQPNTRATEPPAPVVNVEWTKYVDDFVESYFRANPSFAVWQGRHEFDGQMPDWSAEGIKKEIARLEQMRARAVGFDDDSLMPEERFQRDYVVSRIDNDLFYLREARQPFTNPAWYLNAGLDPSTYVNTPYAPADQRARAFIAYVKQVPGALNHIKSNLELPLPRTFVDFSVKSYGGFAEFYRNDVPQAFAEVPEELKKELAEAIEPAAKAIEEFARWLESQRANANDAYALGPERFAAMLRMTENVDVPLDRIEAIGRADLERNLAALNEACKRFAPGAKIEECVARMNADKPEGGAVAGARAQLETLRKFLLDHDIVSIPGIEEAKVEEAPAYRRQNFAYINIPGAFEKELPSVYYIAPPDPNWSRAEQEAYVPGKADLMFTSIHEVWPGHFLQFLHSNRSSWRFGQLFVGYAFAEGWAHYSEELMIEHGIAATQPELHVGQLLNALLRNVRYMCAVGLHTQGMTVAQCEQMFKEKAFQDAGNARQQAARGTYDPGYLNYTMGKLMIRKLRDDWAGSRGGRQAWKQFNDEFLSYGGPPVPLVRSQMLPGPAGELF
ncbi:DUF885 domain-containing protein [Steroidobacter sp. S1-65]|uniref:DUF885 domain-containing protein n=1 Tax=Steroidobacter gossypii TaxID=2805490 RepID=A0ABS1WRU7_9GAMM|nr:DUF885 domain-containing protein [Steroidobacter gossypii]MBM0103705.1 DUF885 domain-containing protein [Steroidobacter gossypii]